MTRLTILLVLSIILQKQVTAQVRNGLIPVRDEFAYSHIIKANLLSPFIGVINFQYEVNQTPNTSSQFEAFYFTGQILGQSNDVRGFGLTYNFRFYLTGAFPTGWYIQPYGRFQNYWEVNSGLSSTSANQGNLHVYTAGMVFGYQLVFAKRLCVDFYGGTNYNRIYENGSSTSSSNLSPIFSGGFVRLGSTLGFVF